MTVNCELSTVSSECRALLTNLFILFQKCFKIRFGVVLRPQLSLLAASWELLQSTQVPFGSSWGPLGSSWEALGSFKIDLGPMLRARIRKPWSKVSKLEGFWATFWLHYGGRNTYFRDNFSSILCAKIFNGFVNDFGVLLERFGKPKSMKTFIKIVFMVFCFRHRICKCFLQICEMKVKTM